MTNIQTLALIDKVEENASSTTEDKFVYSVRIECYFNDRSKKLFEYEESFDSQLPLGYAEDFQAKCTEHMYSQVDVMQLKLTWVKMYVKKPGREIKPLFNFLPTLHYGNHVESCLI